MSITVYQIMTKKSHDLILFLFVYQLFIYNDSFCHDMINCAIVNCNPPPQPRGKGGDMWCIFPLLTLSYALLGGGFSSYGSPTLVCGVFMWECTQPAKGLFI